MKKLNEPYSNCKNEYSFIGSLKDTTNESPYPYFQSEYYILCRYRKDLEICGYAENFNTIFQYYFTNKIYFYEKLFNLTDNCWIYNASLLEQVDSEFRAKGEISVCQELCQGEWNSISYLVTSHTRVTNFSYPIVHIYYEEFTYTLISEQPKITVDNLWGNIGGLLGNVIDNHFFQSSLQFL